jgi:hypothetical protein
MLITLQKDFVKVDFAFISTEDLKMYADIRGLAPAPNDTNEISLQKNAIKKDLFAWLKSASLQHGNASYDDYLGIDPQKIQYTFFGVAFSDELLRHMPKEFYKPYKVKFIDKWGEDTVEA